MRQEENVDRLYNLIKPIVSEKGYELYHVEFIKEQGEYYLRVYIEHENGITHQDCEKVSRALSDMLDIEDPISESYYLEVSSPGVYRTLFTDMHLERYIGSLIRVKLDGSFKGKREITGILKAYDENKLVIEVSEEEISLERNKIKNISLEGEL